MEGFDLAWARSSPKAAVVREDECSSCVVCCPAEGEIPRWEMLRGMQSVPEVSTHEG